MVVFMMKGAIAAIPAFIILTVIGVLTWAILGGLLHSWTLSNEAINIENQNPMLRASRFRLLYPPLEQGHRFQPKNLHTSARSLSTE